MTRREAKRRQDVVDDIGAAVRGSNEAQRVEERVDGEPRGQS